MSQPALLTRPFRLAAHGIPILLLLAAGTVSASVFQWLQHHHFSQAELALHQAQRMAAQQCQAQSPRETCRQLSLVNMDAPLARAGKWHFQFQSSTIRRLDVWVPESRQIAL